MADITKIQHHIPRMILKRFSISDNQSDILFYNSLKANKVEVRNVVSVAKEKHLYSVIYKDNIDVSLENYFSSLESEANILLDKLLKSNYGEFKADDISLIVKFVISLMYRSKRFVRSASKFSKQDKIKEILLSRADEMGFPKETAEKFFSDLISIKGFAYQKTFEYVLQERHLKFVENFDVTLITCWGIYPKFILQDNYATVVRVGEFSETKGDINLWDYPIEIVCPLSMNVCLLFSPKVKNRGNNIFDFSIREMSVEQVMDINRLSFVQKDRDIYGSCEFEIKRLINSYS